MIKFSFKLTLIVSRKTGFDESRQTSSPCYSNCSEKRRLTFDGKDYSYSHNYTVPLRMCWTFFFFSIIICLVMSPSAILGDFFHLHAQLIFCWKEQIWRYIHIQLSYSIVYKRIIGSYTINTMK